MGPGDPVQLRGLAFGEVLGVLPQRPPGVFDRPAPALEMWLPSSLRNPSSNDHTETASKCLTGQETRGHQCDGPLCSVYPFVELTATYYNSKPQVKSILKRAGRLLATSTTRPAHQSAPEVSTLAAASGTEEPRHLRDRLSPDDLDHIRTAARAGVPRKALAAQYSVCTRSIYRILTGKR